VTFVDDEVPCFLHTGRWFGIENWDVVPDVIAIGKGLSGGFAPVGAVIARREIFGEWGAESGRHFTTYMGYPVGCAGALANLESVRDSGLLEVLRSIGQYLKGGLERLQEKHRLIGEVSGVGGLLGMEFVRDRDTKEPAVAERNLFAREALRRGVVIPDAMGDSPRSLFIPPASLTRDEMDIALGVMDECMSIVEAADR
jgi:4-aminobutyrate aminotransferase-like enzyme